jgi:hypothetical protein
MQLLTAFARMSDAARADYNAPFPNDEYCAGP